MLPRRAIGPAGRTVPRDRAHERGAELGGGGDALRARAERRGGARHPGPPRRTIEEIATADVVITTYTLFRLDSDAYASIPWAALILDEAQYVKNHRGKTYRCARELRAPFKLAITGTPMENNLMELWALLSITAPGLFPDPPRFASTTPGQSSGAATASGWPPAPADQAAVKRRTKELVAAELPPKQEQTLEVELHPRHRKLYDTHLQRERQKVLRTARTTSTATGSRSCSRSRACAS